jgi:hypothetical protein
MKDCVEKCFDFIRRKVGGMDSAWLMRYAALLAEHEDMRAHVDALARNKASRKRVRAPSQQDSNDSA